MRFRRTGFVLALLSLSLPLCAQTKPQSPRVKHIWDTVHNRTVDQVDYWFEEGDYPRVIRLLQIKFELDPHDEQLAADLGYMLENVERYGEALAVHMRFRKENPNLPDAPFEEANFYYKRRAYSKVPPLLEPTLKLNPHPNSYRLLAHSYERMSFFADSKRVWEMYLKRFPNDEPAKGSLKRVEEKMKGGVQKR